MFRSDRHTVALVHASVLAILLATLSACGECGWCREGFICDRMVVTVRDGVTRAQVDRMNAELGARGIDASHPFYVLQLPEDVDACDAMDFYGDRPEVNSVLPDTYVEAR